MKKIKAAKSVREFIRKNTVKTVMRKTVQLLSVILILFPFLSSNVIAADSAGDVLAQIPVQDSGRIKPFDTFARESLQLIYGKKSYKDGQSAAEVVFTWILLPQVWEDYKFVKIDNHEMKKQLGLSKEEKYFSPREVITNKKLETLFQELQSQRDANAKLNPFYQAIQTLESQLTLFKAIGQGFVPGFYPQEGTDTWVPIKDFNSDFIQNFAQVSTAFAKAVKGNDVKELQETTQLFVEKARSLNISKYPSQDKIFLEIKYNNFHPFQWAWIFYFSASVLFLSYFVGKKEVFFKLSVAAVLIAFLLHTYGFVLRVILAGRPPVSNMYETVIWVPWAAVLFALILLKSTKNRFFILAASITAFVCLVLADLAPVILDSSIQPLQPVLRSNLWLTIHVLTITLSYGAFFLAFVLGDIGLIYYAIDEKKYAKSLTSLRDAMYRATQIGVVLIGAGTILGGVWADYSWGRFWGWDPKETWALIAFLGYIAILHGRFAGWIKPFGFTLWIVLAFNLVVMAWYGVNFVLGAGLHSYGFGAGGVEFMAIFTGFHILFGTTVWFLRMNRKTA